MNQLMRASLRRKTRDLGSRLKTDERNRSKSAEELRVAISQMRAQGFSDAEILDDTGLTTRQAMYRLAGSRLNPIEAESPPAEVWHYPVFELLRELERGSIELQELHVSFDRLTHLDIVDLPLAGWSDGWSNQLTEFTDLGRLSDGTWFKTGDLNTGYVGGGPGEFRRVLDVLGIADSRKITSEYTVSITNSGVAWTVSHPQRTTRSYIDWFFANDRLIAIAKGPWVDPMERTNEQHTTAEASRLQYFRDVERLANVMSDPTYRLGSAGHSRNAVAYADTTLTRPFRRDIIAMVRHTTNLSILIEQGDVTLLCAASLPTRDAGTSEILSEDQARILECFGILGEGAYEDIQRELVPNRKGIRKAIAAIIPSPALQPTTKFGEVIHTDFALVHERR
jgi:hypothetical protein